MGGGRHEATAGLDVLIGVLTEWGFQLTTRDALYGGAHDSGRNSRSVRAPSRFTPKPPLETPVPANSRINSSHSTLLEKSCLMVGSPRA